MVIIHSSNLDSRFYKIAVPIVLLTFIFLSMCSRIKIMFVPVAIVGMGRGGSDRK